MEHIQSFFRLILNMGWRDFLDILLVAMLFFWLLPVLRSTGTMRVGKVIIVVLVIAGIVDFLKLNAFGFILDQFLTVGLIAIVVLFQPELRRMLDHISSVRFKKMLGLEKQEQELVPVIRQTVQACEAMSRERVGALIVFARDSHLEEYMKSGTMVDAVVTDQLIRNIFFPKAALHDGAMIIQRGRVAAAACVLPLSDSQALSADLGTRHRAGVGMSEASDAVVVIVSEETGAISVAVGGMLKRHLAPQTLEKLLRQELCFEESGDQNIVDRLMQKLSKKKGDGDHE